MEIKTIKALPPELIHYFNYKLLSIPYPKFCDDSQVLWEIFQYINETMKKSYEWNPNRHNKYLELRKVFVELYERTEIKEKELEEKTGHANKAPFTFFTMPDKRCQRLFGHLRNRRHFRNDFK